MYAANTYRIHLATDEDAAGLHTLAELNSHAPLVGRVLIAYVDGTPAAAISVEDQTVLTHPDVYTDYLVPCLRARVHALLAYQAEPSLSKRILAAVPGTNGSHAETQNEDRRPVDAGDRSRSPHRSTRRPARGVSSNGSSGFGARVTPF